MAKRKEKQVSVDTMFRSFLKTYDIPTKRDIDRVMARLDRLERLALNVSSLHGQRMRGTARRSYGRPARSVVTATDMVLEVAKSNRGGVGFKEIQSQTGFEEKKIRNIIFRLDKLGRIKRVDRGVYTAV